MSSSLSRARTAELPPPPAAPPACFPRPLFPPLPLPANVERNTETPSRGGGGGEKRKQEEVAYRVNFFVDPSSAGGRQQQHGGGTGGSAQNQVKAGTKTPRITRRHGNQRPGKRDKKNSRARLSTAVVLHLVDSMFRRTIDTWTRNTRPRPPPSRRPPAPLPVGGTGFWGRSG